MSSPVRVAVVSLGCVRNTADTESLLETLDRRGIAIAGEDSADAVIVNTCGFIEAAKKESVDVISRLARLKSAGRLRYLVVAGCLSQRYADDLRRGFPEVDAWTGTLALRPDSGSVMARLTPRYSVYLKICESCFNRCSFCAIPGIKGKFVSRPHENILADARALEDRGAREINIIGQDITAYGMDLYGEKRLAGVLRDLARAARQVRWFRLLYTFPAHITDELIDVIAAEPNVCKYVDMPLQHVNDRILGKMARGITRAGTEDLVRRIRRRVPGVSLRTTVITGFPGETDAEFEELIAFIKDHPFERLGAFAYSREEGTPAAAFPGQVSRRVRQERLERLMRVQEGIAAELQERMVGRTLEVLVEKPGDVPGVYTGRSQYDAPDVDGCVFVQSRVPLEPGVFVPVRITAALGHDLEGVLEERA